MKNLKFESIILLSHQEKKAVQTDFHPKKNLIVGNNHTGKSSIIKNIFLALGARPNGKLAEWDENAITAVRFSIQNNSYLVVHHMGVRGLFDINDNLISATKKDSDWTEIFCSITDFNLTLTDKNKSTVSASPRCFFLPFYIDQDSSWGKEWSTFVGLQQYKSPVKLILEYFTGIKPPEYYSIESERLLAQNECDELLKELSFLERAKLRLSQSISLIGPRINSEVFEKEIVDLTKQVNILNVKQENLRENLVRESELIKSISLQIDSAKSALNSFDADFKFLENPGRKKLICPTCGAEHKEDFMSFLKYADEARILRQLVTKLQEDLQKSNEKYFKTKNILIHLTKNYITISKILESKKGLMEFKDVVESAGAEQAINAFYNESDRINKEIDAYFVKISRYEMELRKLKNLIRSKEILNIFRKSYSSARFKLNLNPMMTDKMQLTSRPYFSGSGGPRSILAYYFAIWKTVYSESMAFFPPLVVDSPNQKAQDEFNLPRVIQFIAEELPADAQVIMCSEIDTSFEFDCKIVLDSPYGLLKKESYSSISAKLEPYLHLIHERLDAELSIIKTKKESKILNKSNNFVEDLKIISLNNRNIDIEEKISEYISEIMHSDEVSSLISETNAYGWWCDEFEIEMYRIETEYVVVRLNWSAAGEQSPEHGFNGDTISGTAVAYIDTEGEVTFEDIKASIDYDYEDDEDNLN